ncbi:MAG: DUF4097 family beta strand repeat-containing protein [Dehalococcoidia bacterium]
MNADRKRALNLLAEGKIDSNQAERLLDALGQTEGGRDDFASGPPSAVGQARRVIVTVPPETEPGEGQDHDDTFTVDGPPQLEVDNFNGRVEVSGGGPEGSFRVRTGILNPDRTGYRLCQEENTIRVEPKRKVTIQESAELFTAVTDNGSVQFGVEFESAGVNRFKTSNGSVKVRLRGELSLKLEASTSNGSAQCSQPLVQHGLSGKNHLIGTNGAGDASLTLQTSNGSISVD